MFLYVAKNGRGDNDSTTATSSSPRDSCGPDRNPDRNPEKHQTTTTFQRGPCETCDGNAVYVTGDEFQDYSESGEIVDW